MAALKDLLERPADRAPIITITGDAGVGKTTLACLFPKPVVLRFEDGLEAIPKAVRPHAFPVANSLAEALGYIDTLVSEESPFKTLVVDTITRLGALIESEVVEQSQNPTKSINNADGGYGAGLNHAAELHRIFADSCMRIIPYGMTLVYVAHSTTENVNPPDGPEFTRYNIRLDKRAQRAYIDDPDLVAYVRLRTRYVTKEKDDRAKAVADKARIIVCHPTGAHISKNRYGIEEPLLWTDKTVNPLIEHIPFLSNHHMTTSSPKAATTKQTKKGK